MTKKKNKQFPNGILLDVGCRDRKQEHFVGIDGRKSPGVDIVHDLERFPYPLESESCLTIKCVHVIEHIPPWKVIPFMDEMWRLLLPHGQLAISAPYAGSPGFYQDPTHCTPITERTWQHFDPQYPLYERHRPKPWKLEHSAYKPDSNVEAILRKVIPIDLSSSLKLANEAITRGAMQKVTELTWLIESLKGKKLETVVEIGTANGGTFYALCQLAANNAKVISIDLPGGEFGGEQGLPDTKKILAYGKKGQTLSFIRENSHKTLTLAKLASYLGDQRIDLLLIDGDHTYEGVKQDYKMYSPLVKKGGLIILHDILPHSPIMNCHVDKFWQEVKKDSQVTELVDQNDPSWGGIGVITV